MALGGNNALWDRGSTLIPQHSHLLHVSSPGGPTINTAWERHRDPAGNDSGYVSRKCLLQEDSVSVPESTITVEIGQGHDAVGLGDLHTTKDP